MKNIIMGICSCALLGILILTGYTLHGRGIRQEELENALSAGMENAMERVKQSGMYAPESNEELVALFMQSFLLQIDSNSQVTVSILDADYEKGLLSAEATLTYRHPVGTTGTVSVRRTVLVEEVPGEGMGESCQIEYLVNGSCYKRYQVKRGSVLIPPQNPSMEGKTFAGWKELDGEQFISMQGMAVEKDSTYVAVFY